MCGLYEVINRFKNKTLLICDYLVFSIPIQNGNFKVSMHMKVKLQLQLHIFIAKMLSFFLEFIH